MLKSRSSGCAEEVWWMNFLVLRFLWLFLCGFGLVLLFFVFVCVGDGGVLWWVFFFVNHQAFL